MQNDVGEQKQLSKYIDIETGAMSHMSIYSSHRSLIEIVTTILSDLKKYIQTYNKQGRINSTFFGFGLTSPQKLDWIRKCQARHKSLALVRDACWINISTSSYVENKNLCSNLYYKKSLAQIGM